MIYDSLFFAFLSGLFLLTTVLVSLFYYQQKKQNSALNSVIENCQNKLQIAEEKIRTLSLTDNLTGLKNKHFFDLHILNDVAKSVREYETAQLKGTSAGQADINILMINVDDFASLNNQYGHNVGDEFLKALSQVIKREVRAGDYLMRFNGDEFMVVTRFMSREKIPQMIQRMQTRINTATCAYTANTELKRTVTIGSASFPFYPAEPKKVSIDQTIYLARHALNAAKATESNAWMRLIGSDVGSAPDDFKDIDKLVNSACFTYQSSIKNENEIVWQ